MGDLPYGLEGELFALKNQALDQIRAGALTDPGTIFRTTNIASTWNDIQPGVALALAKSGYDAHSPETQQVAQLATIQRSLLHNWQKSLSSVRTLADFKSQVGHLTSDEYNQLPSHVQHAITHRATQLANNQADNGSGGNSFLGKVADYLPGVGAAKGIAEGASPTEILTRAVPGGKEIEGLRDLAGTQVAKVPTVGPAIQTGVRTTALAAQTPLDIINGSIRTGLQNATQGKFSLAQMTGSDIQQSAQDVAEQSPGYQHVAHGLSVGTGYLPSPQSPAGQAAAEAARQASPETIGGHAFTPGRYLAAKFGQATHLYEPDSEAFNILSGIVDAGVAIKVDPTAIALGAVGDAREAQKAFNPDTGLIPTTGANVVDPNTKANYLLSDKFTNGAGADIAADPSPSSIKRKYPTLPVETVHGQRLLKDLAYADNVDEVRAAISKATEITGPLDPPGFTYKFRRATDSRLFAAMPYGSIADASDKNVNWKILDDVMRGFNVPEATRNAALDHYILNLNPLAGLDGVAETNKQSLIAHGWDEKTASEFSSFFPNAKNRISAYDIDQATGHERIRPGIAVEGEGHVIASPSLSSEQLNSPIPIMDMRTARRMTSEFPHITGSRPWEITQSALSLPAALWKPLQVLTARMAVRIFGETQLNMATRGMDNAFTDPGRFISLQIGMHPDSAVAKALDALPGIDPSYVRTPEMQKIVSDAGDLFMHTASFIHDPETVVTKNYMSVPVSDPRAAEGLAEQLGKMSSDPIMVGVAKADTPEAAKEWFWDGPGKGLRIERAKITANQDSWMMQNAAENNRISYNPIGDIVNDRAAADRYIDEVMFPRLRDYANTDELRDAVKTGKLGGVDIYKTPTKDWERANIHGTAENRAREILDAGDGPQRAVTVRQEVKTNASQIQKGSAIAKSAVDAAFHGLVDVPDRLLNRHPAFVQKFWEKAGNLLPYADAEAHDKILTLAEDSNVPPDVLDRLRNTTLDATESQRLTAPQLKQLATANALDDIRNIVHDLTTRSQFFDMTRMLLPFGDAFRLIATRWLKTIAEEPQTLRRLQQGIAGVQGAGSGAVSRLFGDPVPHGQGFFHKDAYGNDVFALPGSTWLDKKLIGVPIPLDTSAKGLSLIGEGYPGLGGPTLTVPAKWFLPHTPAGDKIRDIIFPYGNGESSGVGADIGQAFMPSYLQKIVDGPIDQRSFNNKVNMMIQTLASTGDYDLQGPRAQDETLRLMRDARNAAKWVYVIAGGAQFVTPGAPTPTGMIKDPTGRWAVTQVVVNKYHDKVAKDGPDAAFNWLINTYGTKNFFVAQKATEATGYAAPVTKEAQAWVDSHPDIRDKYPLTYGLFAPTKGTFDITTYDEQFGKGERRSLSPAEQIAQAEQRLGFYAYDHFQQTLLSHNQGGPLTSAQRAFLGELKVALKQEYPGFDTFTADPYDTAKRRTQAVDEITRAVADPTIASTDTGQAVQQYLALRTAAINGAVKQGLKTPFSARKALPLRQLLRAGADQIISEHPDFRIVWDNIFSRELANDGAS